MSVKKAVKQKFTASEDSALQALVKKHGTSDWKLIAEHMPNRTSRQCRERWKYYIAPSLQPGVTNEWTKEDDQKLLQKYSEIGPKWSQIARFFPTRTDINLKNRYHRLQRLQSKGLADPQYVTNSQSSDDEQQKPRRLILQLPVPLSRMYVPQPISLQI